MNNKEFLLKLKSIMKEMEAKHVIYGIVNWKGNKEIAKTASACNFYTTEKGFEEAVNYYTNIEKVKMIYALHA